MPERKDVAYFGAGPAGLPTKSVELAAKAFVNYEKTGLGLAEISHRSSTANEILAKAKHNLTQLLSIPNNYEILFAHGGGSGAFSSVVYNLVGRWAEKLRKRIAVNEPGLTEQQIRDRVFREARTKLKVDYLVTGSWSLKASQEAADLLSFIGEDVVNVAADARVNTSGKFGPIPNESEWALTSANTEGVPSAAYVYYCDNETVDGVEFPNIPGRLSQGNHLVVADMSSNILTRQVDISRYGVIFAGAQKNIGITDTTIVIVRKDILAEAGSKSFFLPTPVVMHWPTLAKHGSLYNTIPIFSLFVAADVMSDLLEKHGPLSTGAQAAESRAKAKAIYDVLDANPDLYEICAEPYTRSRMNICFRIAGGNEALEKTFVADAESCGLVGLKGHRSVGGIRISNYNSVSTEAMQRLQAFMHDFTHKLRKSSKCAGSEQVESNTALLNRLIS